MSNDAIVIIIIFLAFLVKVTIVLGIIWALVALLLGH